MPVPRLTGDGAEVVRVGRVYVSHHVNGLHQQDFGLMTRRVTL